MIRFTWRFDRPVAGLADGDPVSARLEATPLSATGGCKGGLAARSPSGAGRVFANPTSAEARTQTGTVNVDTRPVYADRKRAWFSVDIDTSGGAVKYPYEYERVR